MKRSLVLILAALMIIITSCSQKTPDIKSTSDNPGNVQIPNPWVDCASLSEAARLAGFDIAIPGSFDGYPNKMIQAIEKSMIQVLYFDGDPDGQDTGMIMIRKGAGSGDISGDYNEYAEKETVKMHGLDVLLRGDKGLVYSASWESDGYSFAINADKGLSRDALSDAIEEMITVVGYEGPSSVHWAENMSFRKIENIKPTLSASSFDERFLKFISERADGNYMASPLSFRYALGLLLAGAEGDTKTELLSALGVQSEEAWTAYCLDFNGFVEYFASDLERDIVEYKEQVKEGWLPQNSPEPFRALRVANSVWKADWVREDFKEAFRESIEKNYAAEYRFFTQADAVEKINEWADIKTEHLIPKLLSDDYPTEELAIVLMNALYFKDSWQTSFAEYLTQEGDFHARNGKTTRKEFMTSEDQYTYFEDETTKLVILPMDSGVSMAFVLGSTEGLGEKISRASQESVKVTIPKIDLETDFSNKELVDFLKKYGVSLAFDGDSADFSAMIDHPVYVSDIIQKTRIKLDEEGVEAAAVTAIMMDECAAIEPQEAKEFTADQPFSFYIYTTCNDTSAILFAGEIIE